MMVVALRDEDAHCRKDEHRRRQRDGLSDHLLALAAAEAREIRHVERQRRPVTDHRGQRRNEHRHELSEGPELARLREQRSKSLRFVDRPREEQRGHDEHERRGPVLDRAQEVHALVDDPDVQTPEQQERDPLGRRVPLEAGAEQRVPAGDHAREKGVERFTADPGLDPEPAARHERAHQRREIRSDRPIRRPREDRKGDAVFRSRMRVQQDRNRGRSCCQARR